jgi:hypothetical protein
MTTIDWRTRNAAPTTSLEPEWLHDELPTLLRQTGPLGARGAEVLGLSSLGFDVDGVTAHLTVADGRMIVREGAGGDTVVAMEAAAFSDLVQDVASAFGLTMAGRAEMRRGSSEEFHAWEPVLRAVLDERPVYEPGTIDFRTRSGDELDLTQSFGPDDAPEEVAHFLAEAGFVHLTGVFSEPEMEAVSADLDAAVIRAERDDGQSWWARTEDEGWYAARILGFNLQSPTLQELLSTDRFRAIAGLTADAMVQRPPRDRDSAEGLLKKIGVVEGISDVSWHKDCSLGGHSRRCCSMVVGISVTGADAGSGELGVIAGSHRANVAPINARPDLDLPRLPLPTGTGDCTVHCSCTLHMSRPPVERERRVVYTGFDQAPRPGDVVVPTDPAEARRARAALEDQVRAREQAGGVPRDDPDLFALPADR